MKYRKFIDVVFAQEEGRLGDVDTGSDSVVQTQFAEDADINVLAKRYGLLGVPPAPPADARFYGDTEDIPDLRTALDRVRDATDHFMGLPAELRARFLNSPAVLYDFVNDSANADECVRLGLLKRVEVPPVESAPPGVPPGAATS